MAFIWLCLAVSCPLAEAQIVSVQREEPRPFGYFVGDLITLEVFVAVDSGYLIDPASLPKAGPVAYWLDLRSVSVDDLGGNPRQWRLRLAYQNFYVALDVRRMTIPGFDLIFKSGENSAKASVAPWSFSVSPLREILPTANDPVDFLRADIAPAPVSLGASRRALLILSSVSALMLGLVAFDRSWPPFRRPQARPFALAARRLGRMRRDGSTDQFRAALRTMHQSIDVAAGRRVLAEDLESFLAEHPDYRAEAESFTRFYRASHRIFFASDETGAERLLPPTELVSFSQRLAKLERAAA
ncbi:nonribosomal peptide synthetase MxaA [Methylocella silvestris]|uniref:Nonribosomal peptide synthetase MxaA n=2 Tax=Methylocella silvestris TaxID=199596 RepID=A0A2J7TEU1_METSI|nr:nonribosomal peptide synthetase MxaA [Methylocella silvestris]